MAPPAHHLFHFVLKNEMEQHTVGNLSNINFVAPSANYLFHFVLQNEIEQQMVGNEN